MTYMGKQKMQLGKFFFLPKKKKKNKCCNFEFGNGALLRSLTSSPSSARFSLNFQRSVNLSWDSCRTFWKLDYLEVPETIKKFFFFFLIVSNGIDPACTGTLTHITYPWLYRLRSIGIILILCNLFEIKSFPRSFDTEYLPILLFKRWSSYTTVLTLICVSLPGRIMRMVIPQAISHCVCSWSIFFRVVGASSE